MTEQEQVSAGEIQNSPQMKEKIVGLPRKKYTL
jgi:hypothetical protein